MVTPTLSLAVAVKFNVAATVILVVLAASEIVGAKLSTTTITELELLDERPIDELVVDIEELVVAFNDELVVAIDELVCTEDDVLLVELVELTTDDELTAMLLLVVDLLLPPPHAVNDMVSINSQCGLNKKLKIFLDFMDSLL